MNKKYTIAFDASMITDKNAGIGYYARELLYNLSTKADIYAFTNNDLLIQNENIKVFKIEGKVNLLWHLKVFFYIKKLKVDAIVSPSNFIYAILSNKTIQIVHDLAPIRYPSHYGYISSFKFRIYLKLATYRALALATVSQTTSKDLERFARRSKK
ncbi:MAG: hypothetical protein KatS3mg085_017 [Candidatus Dojkabacteria bacterium]|nr:MAG: hypothetical protein KatS3mg085_017 [Candidatus Dojkabacteria bacterium]